MTRQRRAAAKRKSVIAVPAEREDWGQLGPAMRALPNDTWRSMAYHLFHEKPGHGILTRAARAAGFGKNSPPANLAKLAWKIAQDSRMIAAVAEESKKYIRAAAPEASRALLNLVRDPTHRDHGRAVMAIVERCDPVTSHIEVTHKIVDPDQEGLEELRALRALGTDRQKLLELYGFNGLDRLEMLDAADMARRAAEAKVIEGRLIEQGKHMTDDTPDPAQLLKLARQALTSAEFRKKFHLADFWGPNEFYDPQLRFFTEGATKHQRLIRGGNQVGKSFCCAFEAGLHMSGQYPRWWKGRRFSKPTRGWIIGPTGQLVRDGPQRQMCSRQGEFGSGTIPLASFAGKPVMIPGGTGAIDTLSVGHETNGVRDGVSTATFKSFEMRSEKMQSESVDWIWIDERCSEEIYSELIARTTATDGILFLSYTHLKGGGELTYRFLNEYSADRSDTRIEAHQARHISPERRAQLEESYLPHEREARIHGIPQLGIARVFPFPIESLLRNVNPDTDIKSWARWLVGIDFGYGHPFAAALCAWVHDTEEFFVVDGFKMARGEAFYHVKRIAGLCRGLRIPIAWPHDGLVHEKGSGEALADVYRRLGAPMLPTHAENKGGGYHTEPAIAEMTDYMKRGAFAVASHMSEFAEEYLSYHRDEDYKIVRLRDDLISATRYAFMMRRHGKALDGLEEYGRAPGIDTGAAYDPRPPRRERKSEPVIADGVDFNLFTGR